ncbi:DUF7149 domain-containing protein [Campylobacter molothri]|uniref:DUF7149 domain-containing protein n=1 Tax=Campylobacter TaxID=194 RepID=UPI001D883EAD|nr:class I SAM-dependent DNA methyltransferase [Campylobacter sp. W0045]
MRFKLESLEDFTKKYHIKIPTKDIIEDFKNQIKDFLKQALKQNLEEFQKNEISHFLKKIYGYEINIKDRIDLAIYQEDIANVIFEVKSTTNKKEFPQSSKNLLSKAFYESILYFLRERKNKKNNFIKHIILCNAKEFFIIDAREYERLFYNDKEINKHFKNCDKQEGTSVKTEVFFEKVANYLLDFDQEICYTYFALDENLHDKDLSYIYQILSPQVLLRQKQNYDANALNSNFYKELLYILGLHENDKKNIILSDIPNTLSDAIRQAYKDISFDDIFALLITWNNRILFLRLFESMLLSFEHIKIPFLTASKIPNFIRLSELFFEVLAKKEDQRKSQEFDFIPYMNSSLFDKNTQEMQGKDIRFLDSKPLEIYANSILKKDKDYVNLKHLPLLEYLFAFLRTYDFTTTNKDIQNNQKINHDKLINSSVLGNVFEKLNGYKEGSFYTPSFITSYMCEESITKVVLDKFNAKFDLEAKDISELRKALRKEDKKAQKELLNSIKICDPAVGSGHFLVSALNVMIKIYDQLNLFEHEFYLKLENDEILIQNNFNDYISYKCPIREDDKAHLIQQELFHIKKDIIENCLFGVDINPNSCEITKLRLWIELLKFSYYIFENGKNTHTLQTLPNIDINIKCGNSLIAYFDTQKSLSHYPNIKERMKKYQHIVKDYKEGFYTDKNLIAKEIKNLKESFKNFCLKDKFAKEIKQLTNNANEYSKKYGDFLADEHHDEKFKSFFSKNMFEFSFDEKAARKEFKKLLDLYERIFELEKSHPFEWRFEFPEVLDNNGNFQGFDLIIGNPPYIKEADNKELFVNTKKLRTYQGKMDIWYHFVGLGFDILKNNGYLSFIATNNWITNSGAKKLRNIVLEESQVLSLIDFNSFMVFDSASIQTMIMQFQKIKPSKNYEFHFAKITTQTPIYKDAITLLNNEKTQNNEILNINLTPKKFIDKTLNFTKSDYEGLFEKIQKYGKFYLEEREVANGIHPHYDFINNRINSHHNFSFKVGQGIFGLSQEEKEKLRLTQLENDLVKPYYDTQNFSKFFFEKENYRWIIYTNSSFKNPNSMDNYPNLKKHLDKFKKVITSDNKPYGLHRARDEKFFTGSPRIVALRKCVDEPKFSYVDFDCYVSATFYIIKTHRIDIKYLVAILNSKLIAFWLRHKGKMQGNNYQIDKEPLLNIPIININSKNQKTADELVALVDEIFKAKEQDKNADTKIQEDKINTLVYKLYNLTEDEIKIIKEK